MKIMLIGSNGSIGRRYKALLKSMEYVDLIEIEVDNYKYIQSIDYDRAIIATPTDTHYSICVDLIQKARPLLIEKPVCKKLCDIDNLRVYAEEFNCDIRMVCNWAYTRKDGLWETEKNRIYYNYFNTGKDGLYWDVVQLAYLAKKDYLKLGTNSPFFTATIRPISSCSDTVISLKDVEWSYMRMLNAWINKKEELWDLDDAYNSTKKVLELIDRTN